MPGGTILHGPTTLGLDRMIPREPAGSTTGRKRPYEHSPSPALATPPPHGLGMQMHMPMPPPVANGLQLQVSTPGTGTPGAEGQPPINHAIDFVNRIKQRYTDEPEVYRRFLDVLHRYQKGGEGSVNTVCLTFR
jgi:paired amphipathic helix protein Sin3a